MSNNVDNRVVEMQFDNKQFESGINTSINSISKLKQSLDFKEANKSIEALEKAGKKFSLGGMMDAFDTLTNRISNMGVVGTRVIQRLTDDVYNYGKRLLKSFTTDPIESGWKKLEDKTTSVATLISQGYDMSTVEDQLERLAWFTDETSYAFTDMVSNIAKFTAAGKDLPESVTALMGVANWAALSGQNASTASHAMFQLSQAMGAGVMRKEDWKSIQNVSMDTDEFRQKALDAGVAIGTLRQNMDGTYESLVNNQGKFEKSQFAEHLTQDAWMTSEVMMKVFNDYSAAVDEIYQFAEEHGITASDAIEELGGQIDEFGLKAFRAAQEAKTWTDVVDSVKEAVSSGWSQTFEYILGNYEEQRVMWTGLANTLYDVFAEPNNQRNEMLKEWKELGGRTDLLQGIQNVFENLSNVIQAVRDGFAGIFPKMTAERLKNMTDNFKMLTEKMQLSDKALQSITKVSRVLSVPFRILSTVFQVAAKTGLVLAKLFVALVTHIDDVIRVTKDAIIQNETLNRVYDGVRRTIGRIVDALRSAKDAVIDFITNFDGVDSVAKIVASIATAFKNAVPQMASAGWNIIRGLVQGLITSVPMVVHSAIDMARSFVEAFDSYMAIRSPSRLMMARGGFIVAGLLLGISAAVFALSDAGKSVGAAFVAGFDKFTQSTFGKKIGSVFISIKDTLAATIPTISGWLKTFASNLNTGRIAAFAFLASGVYIVKQLASFIGGIASVLSGLGNLLTGIETAVTNAGKSFKKLGSAVNKMANAFALTQFAVSVGILVGCIALLSVLPADKAQRAIEVVSAAILGLAVVFIGISQVFTKMPQVEEGIKNFARVMLEIAAAAALLAGAVWILAQADKNKENAIDAVIGVGVLILALGAVAKLLSNVEGDLKKAGRALVPLASAVLILTKVLTLINNGNLKFDWNVINVFAGLIAVMGFLALIARVAGDKPLQAAIAINILLGVMLEVVAVMGLLGALFAVVPLGPFLIGLGVFVVLGGILAVLAKILKAAGENALKAAGGIFALAAAVAVLAFVFKKLSELQLTFGQWLGAVASLAAVVVALRALMKMASMKIEKPAGILAMVAAIVVITGALATLTLFTPDELLMSMLALGVILGAMAYALKQASEIKDTKSIVGLGVAILALAAIVAGLAFLQKYDWLTLGVAAVGLGLCLGMLGVALRQASKIDSGTSVLGIIMMAGTVWILGEALSKLAHFDWPSIAAAGGAMAVAMIGIARAAKLANDSVEGALTMLVMAGAAALVMLSLNAMAQTASAVGIENVIAAVLAISITMLALAGAAALANSALTGAVALVAVAAAAYIAGLSLSMLAGIADPQSMLAAAGAIVGTLVILAGAAALLGVLSAVIWPGIAALAAIAAVLLVVSVAMLVAAGAFALFAAGIAMIAGAIAVVTPMLPQFADGVAYAIATVTKAIVEGAHTLGTAGSIAFMVAGTMIIMGLVSGIGGGVVLAIGAIVGLAAALIAAFKNTLQIHSPSALFDLFGGFIGQGLVNGINDEQGAAEGAGKGLANSVVTGLTSKLGNFTILGNTAGSNFLSGFTGSLQNGFAGLGIDFNEIFGNQGYSEDVYNGLQTKYNNAVADQQRYMNLANQFAGSNHDLFVKYFQMANEAEARITAAASDLDAYQRQHNLDRTLAPKETKKPVENAGLEDLDLSDMDFDAGGGGGGGGGAAMQEETKTAKELLKTYGHLQDRIKSVAKDYQHMDKILVTDKKIQLKASTAVLGFAAALQVLDNRANLTGEALEINLETAAKALADFQSSITKTVDSQMKLFSVFDTGKKVKKSTIMKSFETQIKAMQTFMRDINALSKKGINPALLKEIAEMGPSEGYAYAEAINSMTSEEIEALNKSYEQWDSLKQSVAPNIVDSLTEAMYAAKDDFGRIGGIIGEAVVDTITAELWDLQTAAQREETASTLEGDELKKFLAEEVGKAADEIEIMRSQAKLELAKTQKEIDKIVEGFSSSKIADALADAIQAAVDRINAVPDWYEEIGDALYLPDNTGASAYDLEQLNEGLTKFAYTVTGSEFKNLKALAQEEAQTSFSSRVSAGNGQIIHNIVYNQNNYSPKALPAIDIYRNTNRQLNKKWGGS